MICVNCGRPLSDKICDYCGTDYRTDEEKKELECNHINNEVVTMKRIIEIEEKDLERIREIVERENKTALSVTTRGTAYITIADSKPYEERPQGDLISREALKNDISEKVCDKFERWNKTITCAEFETFIRDVIDDAPTVELSPVINMKPLTAEEKQGLIDALKKSGLNACKLDDEGIQNEWGKWVISEIRCPECLEYYDPDCYSKEELNKCPNCGAPMLKGGDDA